MFGGIKMERYVNYSFLNYDDDSVTMVYFQYIRVIQIFDVFQQPYAIWLFELIIDILLNIWISYGYTFVSYIDICLVRHYLL